MPNDSILSNLTKNYTDKTYRHTTMLRHKGAPIAFAMDDQRRIYYAVLDMNSAASANDSPLDVNNWPAGPTMLLFPNEIAEVGFGIADQTLLLTYQTGGSTPVPSGVRLNAKDIDFFRSTTARFTANAPFQVLSDGQYVYLFRQAVDGNHPDMVFKRDKDGALVLDQQGKPVPLVNATLLVDRFLLLGTKLSPKLEVRYQRSRSKTRPQSRKDSLGAKDLDGNSFYEPTQELKFIGDLEAGRFAALLLPTQVIEVERWQIFAQNRHTQRIDSFNVERSSDGLFNTRGSQDFSAKKEGLAESALALENPVDHVALTKGVVLGSNFSMEAWIFPEQTQSTVPQMLVTGAANGTNAGGPALKVVAQTKIRVDFGNGQGDKYTSKSILTPNIWNHLAVTFDGTAFRFYVGGNLRDKIELSASDEKPPAKPVLFFGAAEHSFKGILDEIRLWSRARSARELQTDMSYRLTGLEPGLAGYWRFDEAGGDTVFDQTNNGANGVRHGGEWVTSDAPIGENPGINRNSFQVSTRKTDGQLEMRSLATGLSAMLYYQQSNVPSGYDGQEKPLKQNARVMLAFASKGSAADDKDYIASLDFGVSGTGRIAQVPDNLALELVNADRSIPKPINQQLDEISAAEGQVRVLAESVEKAKREEQKREAELLALQNALDAAQVMAYKGVDYTGAFLTFGKGDVPFSQLFNADPDLNFNDKIASLQIAEPLQVTVFEHGVNVGQTKVLIGDIPNLGAHPVDGQAGVTWDAIVSSLRIEANPDHNLKIQKAEQRLLQIRTELAAKQVLLDTAHTNLQALQSVLRTGAEVTMPLVHLDASGLSVSGGLLGFAWTNDRPLLFDSATGTLALYFRGGDDQFFAAYYTTFTEKAKYPLTDIIGNQSVICMARSADLGMDKIVIEVSGAEDSDTCTVTIAGAEIEEIWTKMPRHPEKFSRVLNGQAGHYENNKLVGYREFIGTGTVALDGSQLSLKVPNGIRRALDAGATLMVGTTRMTVKQAVANQATTVLLQSAVLIFPPEPLPIYFLEYDYAADASTTKIPGDLFGGSLLLRAVSIGSPSPNTLIAHQRVTSGATTVSKWTAVAPGSTLSFDGKTSFVQLDDLSDLKKFDPDDDVTLEAWMRPNSVTGKSRVIQHQSAKAGYTLGLQQKDMMSALQLDGTDDYVDLGSNLTVGIPYTLEAWIYPSPTDDEFHGFLGGGEVLNVGATRSPSLWIVEKDKIHGGFGDGSNWNSVVTDSVLTLEEWNHVAATFDGTWHRVFVNGLLAHETDAFAGRIPKNEPIRYIGRVDNFFPGRLDDVRVWKRARTQPEILADMNRRLIGNETDLVGYWHFENKLARDFSRNNNEGTVHGEPEQKASPLPAYSVFAGVNGKFVRSKQSFPAGNWAHFTAVFTQDYGLQFDGTSGYLDCGKDESLNINSDLTLEAFLQIESWGVERGIVHRSKTGDNNRIPYAFSISRGGHLVFSFEDDDGNPQTFTSTPIVSPAQPHRVGVTRKRQSISYKSETEQKTYTFTWYDIGLHIDGTAEFFKYTIDENTRTAIEEAQKPSPNTSILAAGNTQAPSIGRSDQAVEIGRTDATGYFKGIISEVRIWNASRETSDVGKEGGGSKESGLVAWWRFDERDGNKATDSSGQNHATIHGNIRWVKNPAPLQSGLVLYSNDGNALPLETISSADFAAAENQFALGALANSAAQEWFNGELEEVRVWKTSRTQEQILDNLFRRLNGELDHLIAYYTFDAEQGSQLTDNALRGNHLVVQGTPNYVLSTAPIGDDVPQVRSALAGIRTPFSGFIHSSPAVQEYGDMQFDSQANLIGVFKRCYTFIKDGHWQLLTGYKVGDLAVEWIGQVQFAPQLIGFIEGAPPVPSENLTQPSVEMIGDLDDYNEASTVELAQADETTYSYASSKERGFGLEVEAAIKFGAKSKSDAGGGIGFISLTSIEESTFLIGLRARFEAMWSWMEEASVGTTRTTGKTTSLEMRGRYTSPEESENEPFKWRRFVPDNVGLALVQSETADVFALRLKHNNALISFSMRPNPDIPKDWNIIHFPINPRYVKQGTLDGKIGPAPDVDYPNALTYSSDTSYFKPKEAYALKNRIQKEEKELETYYNQFAAADKGRLAYFPSESALDLAEAAELRKKLRRNLVNTYVWTADGGLFAESQQTMEVQTETSGGSYEFTGAGGLDLNVAFAIVKVAVAVELNAMFVGHHEMSVSKSKESTTSFQLDVNLDKVERDIYIRDENKVVLTDNSDPNRPKPIKHPYKVDAYRFMSFYLEPNSDHFDLFFNQIVDPIWLEQSDDPSAAALREARQEGKKPPCWRIMHRVTYVSRVLPPLDNSAPPSLEKALQTLDIESNYELIKQLEPYVSNKLTSFPDFAEAVRDTIEQNLPELQPHTEEVIQYMSLYFGITNGQMPDSGQFGETTLSELAPNQPPIVNAGLDQVIGLDGSAVSADLDAAVIDDRLEKTEAIFVTWEKMSGPEGVSFEDIHSAKTKVTFTKRGRYELQLRANDGLLEAADTLTIIVNERPVITAGPNQDITALETLLAGAILDDGLGDPATGVLTVNWSKQGTLGQVVFEDNNALNTKATFQARGHYLLKLSVSNSTFDTDDEVLVAVAARATKQLQALYTFEENGGTVVHDVSAAGTPLDLMIVDMASVSWLNDGLRLNAPTLLSTTQPATRLTDAIKASGEITVEAWLKPAVLTDNGLARILTLSSSAASRNFTLGQSGNNYHIGLRSTTTNNNASNKALSGGNTDVNSLAHLVCTRAQDGLVKMYLNGIEIASRAVSGDFSNWDNSFQLALGNELGSGDGLNRAWQGEYHLVAIYNRALTQQEVLQNFDFGANANLPPIVEAGDNQVVDWQNAQPTLAVQMAGRVANDRPQENTTIKWAQVGGPGSPDGVVFENDNNPPTKAVFSQKGRYTLRLTADDGALMTSDEVTIVVHRPPQVSLPFSTKKIALTGAAVILDLTAEVPDNGWGDDTNPANVTYKWSRVAGPNLQITHSDKLQAKANFSTKGVYELKFEVNNGRLSTAVSLHITVNQAPAVNAGPNQIGSFAGVNTALILHLDGKVAGTGLGNPNDALVTTWEKWSGPLGGNVEFGDAHQLKTTATFTVGGVYVLRLSATNPDNPELTASSDVTITANRAPAVDAGPNPMPILLQPTPAKPYTAVRLDGTVSDDGLPDPPGLVTLKWSKVSGPGNVTFVPDNEDYTEARFLQKGTYVLQLEANDGHAKTSDQVTVVVEGDNPPPDMIVIVSETGNPSPPIQRKLLCQIAGNPPQSTLSVVWSRMVGATPITFEQNPSNKLETTATFPQPGFYKLKATVSIGASITIVEEVELTVD